MNCRDWEERLTLYASGDLPRREAAMAEGHLAECPGCQLFASGMKESLELVQQAHLEPLLPAHFAVVRTRVLAELERKRRPFWRRRWLLGFAAVAAAVLVAVVSRTVPDPAVPPPMVALAPPPAPQLAPPPPRPETPAPRTVAKSVVAGEPVLIKVLSDNPDVVIYWIAETKGD